MESDSWQAEQEPNPEAIAAARSMTGRLFRFGCSVAVKPFRNVAGAFPKRFSTTQKGRKRDNSGTESGTLSTAYVAALPGIVGQPPRRNRDTKTGGRGMTPSSIFFPS